MITRAEYRAALKGRRCYVGLDLSSTKDLTAAVGVFPADAIARARNPDLIDGSFDVLAAFWVPADTVRERVARDRVPYDQWIRDGFLTATPGNVVDYEYIRVALNGWADEFDVRAIAFDPWNATDLTVRLSNQDGLVCVPMRQGFTSMAAPTKALEKAVLARTIRHDGHPVLRWCMGNVSVETDAAGNIKPSKKPGVSTERIDGAVALIMAIDQMDKNNATKTASYQLLVLGGGGR